MYKRVMIKVSGEALTGKKKGSYNRELVLTLAEEAKQLLDSGVQLSLVTGAGNLWRGARSDSHVDRVASDSIGMLATAMNAIYISDCFSHAGIKTLSMSSIPIGNVFETFNKQKAIEALVDGRVLIFAYGTGHPFFSTDTSAALYGSQIEADAIFFLKSGVDGIYTKDPAEFPDEAKFIECITYDEIIKNSDINVIDKAAACICKESGVKTLVFSFREGSLLKAANGEKIGTLCK